MRLEKDQFGIITCYLSEGECLEDVPDSHCDAITDAIRAAFNDPRAFFLASAERCDIANARKWLQRLASNGDWTLVLATWQFVDNREFLGGFRWTLRDAGGAVIGPTLGVRSSSLLLPLGFAGIYSAVEFVSWGGIGCAGGLQGVCEHAPLADWDYPVRSKSFGVNRTTIFGSTACGDVLVYNNEEEAGILSHESGRVKSLGTVTQALEWLFGELLHGRYPDWRNC